MVQIEFSGIAPGHYELTQGDPPRMLELDANSSQQIEAGAGIPTAAVSGTLQTANGAPSDDATTRNPGGRRVTRSP